MTLTNKQDDAWHAVPTAVEIEGGVGGVGGGVGGVGEAVANQKGDHIELCEERIVRFNIMMVGLSGTGKTTLAKALVAVSMRWT